MLLLASMLALQPTVQAEPVLVPAFTAKSEVEAQRAPEFYEVLVSELSRSGYEVMGTEGISQKLGTFVEGCANSPRCVPAMFQAWSAPIALVGAVTTVGERQRVTVRFYVPRERSPAKVFQVDLRPGEAWTTAQRVPVLVDALLTLVDSEYSAPDPVSTQPVHLLQDESLGPVMEPSGEPAAALEDEDELDDFLGSEDVLQDEDFSSEDPGTLEEPAADPVAEAPPETPIERAERQETERLEMGLGHRMYRKYVASGEKAERWLQTRKPRIKTGSLEVSGGMSKGDLHRQYDVRVAISQDGFTELGRYESDIVREDYGKHINVALGYNIGEYIEVSFLGGIQAAEKSMTSGWELYASDLNASDYVGKEKHDHGTVNAYQGVISPRLRLFLLPVGPVKVYGMGGIQLLIADGFHVPDLQQVDYPDHPSKTLFGASYGGGIMVDPQSYLGIFAEFETVNWVGSASREVGSTGQAPRFIPAVPTQYGLVLRPTVGIQYRF